MIQYKKTQVQILNRPGRRCKNDVIFWKCGRNVTIMMSSTQKTFF